MINKKKGQRLGRPCKKCGKRFVPTSKGDRLCLKCSNFRYKKL